MGKVSKSVLRKVYLEKRIKLAEEEFQKRNYLIVNQLINYVLASDCKAVHMFLPISKQREINLFPAIKTLLREKPQLKIITSVSDLKKPVMSHYQINEQTDFRNNKWGIPEPVNARAAQVSEIDVVFIPLISATKDGHRIGYGKGYYDVFLSECRPDTEKIGLSIAPPLDKLSIFEKHDMIMSSLITPFQHLFIDNYDKS